jgi:hypothetical protein
MELELRKLIGLQVIVMGPSFIDNEKLESVKLLAVEDAGIWIQSQEAVDRIVGSVQKKASSPSLAIFIPYTEVKAVLAGIESTGAKVLLDSRAGTPVPEAQ